MITDKIEWNNITRGTCCKESIRHKHIMRKAKSPDTKQVGR